MSELVNPVWTQSHMFLTMSTYNDTEDLIPGEVEIVKDSSFLKNEGTYVAMESFRITAGMAGGIHYTTVTPSMRIEAQLDSNPQAVSVYNKPTPFICIDQNPITNTITLRATNNHNTIEEFMLDIEQGMPGTRFAKGMPVSVNNNVYTLADNLLDEIHGNGFGPNGMAPFPVTVTINNDVATIVYNYKNITLLEFQEFLSRGLVIVFPAQGNAYRLKCPVDCSLDGAAVTAATGGAGTSFFANYSYFKQGSVVSEVGGAGVFTMTAFGQNNFEETANGYLARFFVVPLYNPWGNATQDAYLRTDELMGNGIFAPLRVVQNNNQADQNAYAVLLAEVEHSTLELHRGVASDQQVYSSNEFISFFNPRDNATFQKEWRLNIDSSSGFRITFENGSLAKFRISKALHSFLGLQEALTFEKTTIQPEINKLLFTIHQVDVHGHALFLVGQNAFDNFRVVGTEFFENHTEAVISNSVGHDVLVNGQTYNIDSMEEVLIGQKTVTEIKTSLPISITKDGVEYFEYNNPPPLSYITNTGTICVESLSEFEAIQIVSRSGMMFQPQVGIYSGGNRVLASYRLPFDFGTSNDGDGAAQTMSNAYYGDLQWSNDGNTQYLKLTSSGGVYQIELMAQLVHRDQSKVPVLLFLPPRGLIQMKLRFLTIK